MICDKCKKKTLYRSFSQTKCKECGIGMLTGHTPGYILCKPCGSKLKSCIQCGEELKHE